MSTQRKTGVIYVLLSGLFFGLIGYFGMNVLHAQLSVNTLLFWRFGVAALFMLGVLLIQPPTLTVEAKSIFKSLLCGAVLYGPSSVLYFVAAEEIGSGIAMVLFFTYPAMVMFLNKLCFKHQVGPSYYVAIGMMMIGLFCLMMANGHALQFNMLGTGVSLLSALLFAIYISVNHDSKLPATVDTLLVCFGAMLSAYVVAKGYDNFVIPHTWAIWRNLLGIGTVCTALPILLLLKGLKNIGSLEASILSVLEPIFVVIFGVALLGETITFTQIFGIIVLLSGAVYALLTAES